LRFIFQKKSGQARMFRPVGASRLATSGAVGGDGHSNCDGRSAVVVVQTIVRTTTRRFVNE